MADELNIPTHRWYETRNNIRLPKQDFSRDWIYDSGIQKIDAWINSQPWGNPVPALFAAGEQGVYFDPSDVANLDWRRNLLTWTEQFDNASWSKVVGATVSANTAVAPDGTTTADTISFNTTNGNRVEQTGGTAINGETLTVSMWLKGTGTINLNVGTDTGVGGSGETTIALTSSWVRYSTSVTLSSPTGSRRAMVIWRTGNTATSVDVWGAQLELGSVATDYQPILADLNTEVIERFPTATLYQDPAGTTPVTTTGQSVGLMLDKSKGLVLGSELVTNGDFSNGSTGWTAGANVSFSASGATFSAFDTLSQTTSGFVQGRTYRITFSYTVLTGAPGFGLRLGQTASNDYLITSQTTGTVSLSVVAGGTGTTFQFRYNNTGTFTIDNISVKELPGNHAVQATTANRPIYGIHPVGGRRNLLVRTEEFENSAWTKQNCTILTNTATAPDGTSTADKIQETAVTAAFSVGVAPTMALSTTHTLSVYMKAAERSFGVLNIFTGAASCWTWYDLASGTVGTVGSGATASILSVGNGWYRCVLTIATAASGSPNVAMWPATANNTLTYAGTLGSGILVWGAQIETGSTATNYQRVTDQYNVTEAGVSSVSYLFFDGVNDSLATPSINFATATSDGQARRNLLTFPAAFDDAAWSLLTATVSANSGVAPDGTTTADKIRTDSAAANGSSGVSQTVTTAAAVYTYSAYAKAVEFNRVVLQVRDNASASNSASVTVSLVDGSITTAAASAGTFTGASATVTSVGSGYYRVALTFTSTGATAFRTRIFADDAVATTGNGTSGILAWGAQLETGTTASAFQNIGTDKMTVFAGVQSLSSNVGLIAEISTAAGVNPGAFNMFRAASSNYQFASAGTFTGNAVTSSGVYVAPVTNVLTGLGDISGDRATLRVNGAQVVQSASDQGTGNYLAYPLYIGARGGAGNFFSGNLYSLIVRGAQSNTGQISSTETWVASRTGIVIP
jgi:hypothetical protein